MPKLQVLIAGASSAGKSMSLYNLAKDNPKKVAYLSAEAGKNTPFPHGFTTLKTPMKHPEEAIQFFQQIEKIDSIEYCVLDGFNYLCDMYESMVVRTADDTRSAWGDYADFIRRFMLQVVGASEKKWIILAHNAEDLTGSGLYKYYVPVKGSVAKIGLESYFNIVVYAMRKPLEKLEELPYNQELLRITDRDRMLGYKHVFQVQPTKDTSLGRIRDLMGMWQPNEIYMDNDAALLMQHLEAYFNQA